MFVNLPVICILSNTGWTAKLRNDHNLFRLFCGLTRSCRCEPAVGKGQEPAGSHRQLRGEMTTGSTK